MQRKINHSLKIIGDALDKYGDRIAIASSFGKDSMVTLHLALRINPNIKVFSVMTPFKPQETLDYKDKIEEEWKLNIETYVGTSYPGTPSYETDPEACCDHYKVEPTKRAIAEMGIDAWISGLRGTEGHTRKFLNEIEEKDGLTKYNPILKFTEADIWMYHCYHNITPHPLYLQGYRSLGCEPCSKPYSETERGGRWVGTVKEGAEWGIHTKKLRRKI